MQRLRDDACDRMANATYRSAQTVISGPRAVHVSWIPDTFGDYRHLWQFSPLPDTCVLFARKLLPEVAEALDFFTSCSKLGFRSDCIAAAHTTSLHPDIAGHARSRGGSRSSDATASGKPAEAAPLPQHVPGFVQRAYNSSLS